MIHEKKRESLLSWVQSAGGHDVESIPQLANGKLLSQLVVTLSDKDCSLSGKDDNEPEKTDSVSIDDQEQHKLTKKTVDSSDKESVSQEQIAVNGYHSSDELESNCIIGHSEEIIEAEPGGNILENGVIAKSNDSVLSNKIIVNSHDDDDDAKDEDITDADKKCISVDSFDVAVNGSLKENSLDQVCQENTSNVDCSYDTLKVANSLSHENLNSLKTIDSSESIIPENSATLEVQGHYDVVQKFIENMLELDCGTLVDFSHCMEGHELELAKLTVLLLSAMVQYSLSTKKDHIMASCYSLSADAQEEIMDCLELFLKDRQPPVERKEFHSRLSRCAKLRISPRKHINAVSTPHSNKPARRGRKRKVYNNMEEFFEKGFESPIQNLIKSPDIRHTTPNSEARLLDAVRCKDKTIALLTYDLDIEKFNVDDLKKQNEDLTFQLSKLKKEKDKLKNEMNEVQINLENSELLFEKAQQEWKNEVKSYQSQIKDLKEAEKFWKESYQMEDTPSSQKSECSCSEEMNSIKCAMQAKDDKIKELQKQIEILTVQVEKLSREREDLESKLKENFNSADNPSPVRPSIQEKCFNISDLSLRNELKAKCEELQSCLSEKEIEYSVKIQTLEEILSQKAKVEKEWKARFRKTDKEREDAINSQKKLEIENSNLKGQIEIFKKVLDDGSSKLPHKNSTSSQSPPANRRSSRNRNACDSEKIGVLWHNYEDEAPKHQLEKSADTLESPCIESTTVLPPQSENKSLNKKVSEKSPANKLWRSRSANNMTTSELGDSITPCTMCSQTDFFEVPPLIQNICKIVRKDNIIDTDVLLELHKYERDFNMNDMVRVLTLLSRILKEGKTSDCSPTNSLKRKRDSNIFDLKSDNSLEKVKMSKSHKPEQHPESSSCETLENSEINVYKYKQLLKDEKKKVNCLQSKLKNMKHLQCASEEKLKKIQGQLSRAIELRDTNVERVRKIAAEYELIRQELDETREKLKKEKPAQIIETIIKTPPPPCENCPKLNEKIKWYKVAKEDSENLISSLRDDFKRQQVENQTLKREISKLYKKRNELEEKLSDPKLIGAGVYSPALKTLRDKFSEAIYADVGNESDGSPENEPHNASTVTNYSFTVPPVDGFSRSGKNQSQLRAFCKAEDEAEMLSQSSIFEMQSDSGERVRELSRRNTLCMPHLKSQYPLELNTTPSQHKYFQPPATPSCSRNMTSDRESIHLAKKRKVSKPSAERFRSSFASLIRPSTSGSRMYHSSSTPKVKKSFTQSMHKTNTGAARQQFRSSKGSIGK